MALPPKNPRRPAPATRLPLLLVALAALSSCMDLSAELEIRPDGSGRLDLDYVVAEYAGIVDSAEGRRYLPLPSDRAGLASMVAGIPGLRLEAWEGSEIAPDASGVDRARIRASLSFDSPATLAAFAATVGGEGISAAPTGERGFRLVLSEGRPAMDGGFLAFVAATFPDAKCSFTARLPSPATSDRGTLDAAGTTLTWSIPLSEVLASRDTIEWTVRW